jgi:undecaprenyl pyrophosphate synthase
MLPDIVERTTRHLIQAHDVSVVSIWLLQEYNLQRDEHTVEVLVGVSRQTVEILAEFCLSAGIELHLVGEDHVVKAIYPEWAPTPTPIQDTAECTSAIPQACHVNLIIGYNDSKEFQRAMQRCEQRGLKNPTFAEIASEWCIPPVDVFIRTGQPDGMVNLSSYWPGLERGRILSTPLYPPDLSNSEIDRMIELYVHGVDSSSLMRDEGGAGLHSGRSREQIEGHR